MTYLDDASMLKHTKSSSTSIGYLLRCCSGTSNLSLLGLQSCTRGFHETTLVLFPLSTRQHLEEVESPFKRRASENLSYKHLECQSPSTKVMLTKELACNSPSKRGLLFDDGTLIEVPQTISCGQPKDKEDTPVVLETIGIFNFLLFLICFYALVQLL
jgi:hypothetical protein